MEDELRTEVSDGHISLAHAQREIVTNWVRLVQPSSAPTPSGPPAPLDAYPGRRVHPGEHQVLRGRLDERVLVAASSASPGFTAATVVVRGPNSL